MKKILLILILLPVLGLAQVSRTTISNGNFFDPAIWNPWGFPANGDMLTINHAVTININIYYTAGQILITPSGSLIEDVNRNVWVDGGSLINAGTYSSHLLYVSNGGTINNSGTMNGIDSMLVQAVVNNSGNASFNDFWIGVGGSVNNTGSMTNTDSLLCQGSFTNSGYAGVYDLMVDQMGSLTNSASLVITHDMNNQGLLTNNEYIELAHDFLNCNTQSQDAMLMNNGIMCIGNDFLNCVGDTLTGSGDFYVGNLASNLGVITGAQNFYTPSGTFALQTGTVDSGVNVAAKICAWNAGEIDGFDYNLYPNPTTGIINLSVSDIEYEIYSLTGDKLQDGIIENFELDLTSMRQGVYLLKLSNSEIKRILKL